MIIRIDRLHRRKLPIQSGTDDSNTNRCSTQWSDATYGALSRRIDNPRMRAGILFRKLAVHLLMKLLTLCALYHRLRVNPSPILASSAPASSLF